MALNGHKVGRPARPFSVVLPPRFRQGGGQLFRGMDPSIRRHGPTRSSAEP